MRLTQYTRVVEGPMSIFRYATQGLAQRLSVLPGQKLVRMGMAAACAAFTFWVGAPNAYAAPEAALNGISGPKDHRAKNDEAMKVRGVVRPAASAAITTDLVARVEKIGFREGQHFQAGDVLISFNCDRHRAELASLEAQKREMAVVHRSAIILERRNAGARQDVETTRARLDRASADLDALSIRLRQCTVVAPYNGSVVDLSINAHETARAGKPLITIVSSKEPEIELIVPSSWLPWLKENARFDFRIENTQKTYAGSVTRIGAAVDAVSQTFKTFARFSVPTPEVIPGVSGVAEFNLQGR